jgi:hypothetical protein
LIKPITRKSRNPTRIQPCIAISLRIIRKARAKGKVTISINTIATLARNISKKLSRCEPRETEKIKEKI